MHPNSRQFGSIALAKIFLSIVPLLLTFCLPTMAQLYGTPPDPLSHIREAAKSNVQACSATGETLCEQVAPKIIANAQGNSLLAQNLHGFAKELGGSTAETAKQTRAVDWAVAAFRDPGVEVHTERYSVPTVTSKDSSQQWENVIAEIRGREKSDQWVLVGVHFDLSDSELVDEECNAVLLIEAARDIQLTGIHPRRSIRFVLFGGGDQPMTGSRAYVGTHRAELDQARAAILFDAASGRMDGFALNGRHDIESGVREAMKPIDSLGAGHHDFEAPLETDSLDFLLEGIPTILAVSPAPSVPNGHRTVARSIDDVDIQGLKRNTVITAVLAFDLAERPEPLGPRQSRVEIESLLETTGLAGLMKTHGLWQLWESGRRGRLP